MDTQHLPLGKSVTHSAEYDANQLCPVRRALAREGLGIVGKLPFNGVDLWTAFELSWLNEKGKPVVAVGEISFPCTTPNIIESKSLKLYFNSFNQTRFASTEMVREIMERDLGRVAEGPVTVRLILPEWFEHLQIAEPEGECIDGLDIAVEHYQVKPDLLCTEEETVSRSLHSHLLRTNCPVTGQPDWATVVIKYRGKKITRESLLAYLISYRQHTGFHENCVESIFMDIMHRCQPTDLTVYARFTRRGGIDINPWRSTGLVVPKQRRLARQ